MRAAGRVEAAVFSVWLSGAYPLEFNGLTKSLSLDMRVIDPAWIGKKLRGLKDLPEAQGDFFARQPGSEKQAVQPSTLAYVARLLIHRYEMLGRARRRRLSDGGRGDAVERRAGAGGGPGAGDGADLPGMRPPDADPARRLRLLHLMRACGGLRVARSGLDFSLRASGIFLQKILRWSGRLGPRSGRPGLFRRLRPATADGSPSSAGH